MRDLPGKAAAPGESRGRSRPSFRFVCLVVAATVLLLVSLLGVLGFVRL
jgi:hypothetical protein